MLMDIINLYIDRFDFFSELFIQHIFLTLVAVAFIAVIGLTSGILMTRNRWFASIMLSVTNFLYTIPVIAMFGILVIFTGIGNTSSVIALVLYGMLPLIRNTYVGIRDVDPDIIESAVGMGCTDKQLLFRVQLPLALPVIFAGFRTMVVMTIALAGIASFIGGDGLGRAIWRGITTYYPAMTFAGSLLVALLAIVTDFIMGFIEKYLKKRVLGTLD
ncbi:MAG: ABC transporter permease [Bacillota bacterium]